MNDIFTQVLLSRFVPDGGLGSNGLAERLSELAEADPRMAPVVRHIQERLAAKPETDMPAETTQAADSNEGTETSRVVESNEDLECLTRRMSAELQALRARNDLLATALGACHLCWGEDRACPYCGGAGRIGAYVIDPSFFNQVIGPAARQISKRPRLAKPQRVDQGENHGTELARSR
jgi:hypothetical protein